MVSSILRARAGLSRRMTLRLALPLASLALVACPDDTQEQVDSAVTDAATDTAVATDTTKADTGIIGFDTTAQTDTAIESDGDVVAPDPGKFGAPCGGNPDCESGWCVEAEDGYVCTKECLEDCPDGFDCRSVTNVSGDIVFLCLPRVVKLCTPCLEDFQCNGGACVDVGGDQRCATRCEKNEDCIDGYACREDGPPKTGTYCLPISGSCDCSPPFEGIQRACSKENELGTCRGTETCAPRVGWVGCTAATPVTEVCNYVDDDCDSEVDEDFKTAGVYARREACGGCDVSCDDVLPNTSETACVVDGGLARCQVVKCKPGYQQLSPYICAPDTGGCLECQDAVECVGTHASCTQLADGKYCTRACDGDEDCTDGFVCKTVPESDFPQCVPELGSCTCDGTNLDLSRACTTTFTPADPNQPTTTCKGLEHCTATGWGGCETPDELCDGIDQDCDGVIDGPFKTGDKYTALEHCGACNVSCLAFGGPNATPKCDASTAVPHCGYACVGTAVDVDGIAENGCECIPVGGPDLAGDSLDSNCDGIDGEVDNGVFVSKNGDNAGPGTRELPVQSIAVGIAKASQLHKRDVYVATGVYSENVILAEGVGVFGGYSPFFDEHDTLLYEVAIVGQTPDAQHIGTVTAVSVGRTPNSAETVLDGVTIFGINAANLPGQNSYGIYVNAAGARLRLSKNRVFAGPGGSGTSGARGADGSAGVNGGGGGAAVGLAATCSASTAGGGGGSRTCGVVDVSGGGGGLADCPDWNATPATTQAGVAGKGPNPGTGGDSGFDWLICASSSGGCGAVSCDLCEFPQGDNRATGESGADGADGTEGTAGSGCQNASGSVVSGQWVAGAGSVGGDGSAGSGGGGGGAGGGVEVRGSSCTAQAGDDDLGGSGGGGGAGGCGATGGTGGTGGGGSFGIFLVLDDAAGVPSVSGNTVQGGRGGGGGNGGLAGVGGAAGLGGAGGVSGDTLGDPLVRCASGGGNGGNGGSGGHGGGGGGGCGGSSFGIYASGNAPTAWRTVNTFVLGAGGDGGRGGASLAPSSNGRDGADGFAAKTNF